jgi:cbb3-type cytochrome oxidase cytochrome c subunit
VVLGVACLALTVARQAPVAAAPAAPGAPDGKSIFVTSKCNSCHAIESQKISAKKDSTAVDTTEAKQAKEGKSRKAPDLGGVGVERTADWIIKYLQKLETIAGKKHMKKFKGTDDELKTLAAWLATLKDEKAAAAMKAQEEKEEAEQKPAQ